MTEAERKTLQRAVRDAWLSAVGVVSSSAEGAEARARAQVERLLEAAGEKRSALGDQVKEWNDLVGEIVARVRRNGEALERRVDDGVKAAVAKVRAPIDEKVALLSQRVAALGEKVEARRKRRPRDGR